MNSQTFDPDLNMPPEEPENWHPGFHEDEPAMTHAEAEENGRRIGNAIRRTGIDQWTMDIDQ
jgi:hypothetical protein